MAARHGLILLNRVFVGWVTCLVLTIFVTACSPTDSGAIPKIALLAPFGGEYRDIGYNALFAARLALADEGSEYVQLLAVDDGGDVKSATLRAIALNLDPDVAVIIALGASATHPSTQHVNSKPILLVGNWGYDRADDDSLYASHPLQARAEAADDLIIAEAVARLRAVRPEEVLLSSASPADSSFAERFTNSDTNAPPPNILASLTYDITRLVLTALGNNRDIAGTSYAGLNGVIRFAEGYWQDAPLHQYVFDGEELLVLEG